MSSSRKISTQRAFDAAAADFTALGCHLWDPIGAATVSAAGLRAGARVLDACCGTGASAIPAARAVGDGGVVDAIDLSGPMIDELRRLSADLPQLRAHRADAMEWGIDGYDVVQSALGIFFFPDMTAGTERLISRARPGGRVVFTIWREGAMVTAGRHVGRAVAAVTASAPRPEREPGLLDRIQPGGRLRRLAFRPRSVRCGRRSQRTAADHDPGSGLAGHHRLRFSRRSRRSRTHCRGEGP